MGLDGIIARYSRPYTVTRTLAGARTAGGHYASGAMSSIPIRACVQPSSGLKQQDLPEGISATNVRVLWTKTQLIPVADGVEADVIQIGADRCSVFQVDDWDVTGVAHYYRCLVEKLNIP